MDGWLRGMEVQWKPWWGLAKEGGGMSWVVRDEDEGGGEEHDIGTEGVCKRASKLSTQGSSYTHQYIHTSCHFHISEANQVPH